MPISSEKNDLGENNFLIDLPNPYDLEGSEEALSFGADEEGRIGIITDTMGC